MACQMTLYDNYWISQCFFTCVFPTFLFMIDFFIYVISAVKHVLNDDFILTHQPEALALFRNHRQWTDKVSCLEKGHLLGPYSLWQFVSIKYFLIIDLPVGLTLFYRIPCCLLQFILWRQITFNNWFACMFLFSAMLCFSICMKAVNG